MAYDVAAQTGPAMTQKLKSLVESKAFGNTILGLIVLAAVVVGIETYPGVMARHGRLLHTLDEIIIWLFALEAALKIAAGGRKWYRYFFDPWNVFDFIIVVVCFLPVQAQFAQVLRLARVLRALWLGALAASALGLVQPLARHGAA
ncbi:MAG: ion transporter, partial [Planctomycetota bacterium]